MCSNSLGNLIHSKSIASLIFLRHRSSVKSRNHSDSYERESNHSNHHKHKARERGKARGLTVMSDSSLFWCNGVTGSSECFHDCLINNKLNFMTIVLLNFDLRPGSALLSYLQLARA